MNAKPKILVVDDMPENIDLAAGLLKERYEVLAAINGKAALRILSRESIDMVLLDIMMPELDGFEVCRRIKDDPKTARVPVVFQTALDSRDDILKGLELGAYYYLTKPLDPAQLLAVTAAAIDSYATFKALHREGEQLLESLALLEQGSFRFKTLREARNLAVLVAKAFPDPEKTVLGLTELMINAVEHGNLEISYQDKSRLNELGNWEAEVTRRLQLDEYAGRSAELRMERGDREINVLIRDQGTGFDWRNYLEIDPERAFDTHGRGIAMAKALSFDKLEYRGQGNEVLVTVYKEDDEDT